MNLAETLTVESTGIDTWGLGWYVPGKSLDAAVYSACTVQGPAGSRLLPDPLPSGHRVGYFPAYGLMFAEGHPSPDGLAPGDSLGDRLCSLEVELSDLGLRMGGSSFAGVRRMDATADLKFADRTHGVMALAAIASIQYPRCKLETIRAVGDSRIETVSIRGRAGRRILGRAYDKGVQTGETLAGHWNRLEDQRRFAKAARRDINEMTAASVKEKFEQRFAPLWKATKGVTVGGPLVIHANLAEKIASGELTYNEAERIAGYLALESQGLAPESRATMYRRRAEARAAGVYNSESEELLEVDVSDVLAMALESEAWGCEG
jgi:hypothetical protein